MTTRAKYDDDLKPDKPSKSKVIEIDATQIATTLCRLERLPWEPHKVARVGARDYALCREVRGHRRVFSCDTRPRGAGAAAQVVGGDAVKKRSQCTHEFRSGPIIPGHGGAGVSIGQCERECLPLLVVCAEHANTEAIRMAMEALERACRRKDGYLAELTGGTPEERGERGILVTAPPQLWAKCRDEVGKR